MTIMCSIKYFKIKNQKPSCTIVVEIPHTGNTQPSCTIVGNLSKLDGVGPVDNRPSTD